MRTPVFTRLPLLSAGLLSALALGGCSTFNSLTSGFNEPQSVKSFLAYIAPYKPDVIQGNVVTTEQIQQVKPGMSRQQVRDILGSPLLTDPFHGDRWDYVFTLKRQGVDDQARTFVVLFEKDQVLKIDAPALPTEDEFVASISRKKLPTETRKLELTPEEKAKLPAPAVVAAPATAASAVVLAGASRTYPPLEPATP